MKAMGKITIGLAAAALLSVSCFAASAEGAKPTYSEESLGLRKTTIYSEKETVAEKTSYGKDAASTSTRIKRAFQDAPPMIPHDTEGMLPIKAGDNSCIGCHMPEVAPAMGATPIPVSHFTDFRPRGKVVNGVYVEAVNNYKNEVSIKKHDTLQNARFNCSACHAPQSQGKLLVENTFQPEFTSKDGADKSTWNEKKYTESLGTVIGGPSFVTEDDLANKDSKAGTLGGGH